MAAQAIQRHHRLWLSLSLGVIVFSSCARALRDDSDFEPLPESLQVKTTQAEIPMAPEPVTALPVSPVAAETAVKAEDSTTPPAVVTKIETPKTKKSLIAKEKKIPLDPKIPFIQAIAWPFGIGEEMKLVLKYGVMEGGRATMKMVDAQELEGNKVLHLHGEIQSSSVLNLFYKVDNAFDTFFLIDSFVPVRQTIKTNESKRWGHSILRLNPKKKEAHYYSKLDRHGKSKLNVDRVVQMTGYAQDLFGSLYFHRFLEAYKRYKFPIHDRWKSWESELIFVKKDSIKVAAGKFQALHYKVIPKLEGLLKAKNEADVWLSDDPKRLILKFKSKLKIGSLSGELESYTPGREILLPPPKLLTPVTVLEK
jgi:hypothetical protein